MNDYLAAIDAGTGGVRCVIFDVKGNVVSEDYRETLTLYSISSLTGEPFPKGEHS